MSILRWNDIGIDVDIGPDKELAYRGELVVGLRVVGLLPQLGGGPGRYGGGNLEVMRSV